jgi:hypothetical protein
MIADTSPPADIRHYKEQGLTRILITCTNCSRMSVMGWDKLGLHDSTPFRDIDRLKRFACSGCGSKAVTIAPDWAEYRPKRCER